MKTTLSAAFCLLTATLPLLISEATGQTQGRVDIAGPFASVPTIPAISLILRGIRST